MLLRQNPATRAKKSNFLRIDGEREVVSGRTYSLWLCPLKPIIKCFLWRDTCSKITRLSISKLKWTVLSPPHVVRHAENGTPAVTKWLSGMNITFTFSVDFLKNGQIAGWFEIKSTMPDFLHLKSTPEQSPAQVTRETELRLPVFCTLIKTPQRCLASEIPTYVTILSECCTKLCHIQEEKKHPKIRLHILWVMKIVPQKKEAHHGDCIRL